MSSLINKAYKQDKENGKKRKEKKKEDEWNCAKYTCAISVMSQYQLFCFTLLVLVNIKYEYWQTFN